MSGPPPFRWFDDSPDVGHPDCICSACGKRIVEPEEGDPAYEDWQPPIRIWNKRQQEARFCSSGCYDSAIKGAGLTPALDKSRATKIKTPLGELEVTPVVLLEPGEELE